jgi:hypothetical protein
MASKGLGLTFRSSCHDVLIDVCDIQMATGTRICSMDRLGKFPLADLIHMTAKIFGVVRALVTVFPSLDSGLRFCFQGFGSFFFFGRI